MSRYKTETTTLLRFVAEHGIVTESAKCGVPSLVRFMVGHDYSGNWWGLPESSRIFNAIQPVKRSPSILVCRLVRGKVSLVAKRLWPSLVKVAGRLPSGSLDRIDERHTPSGAHELVVRKFPEWVNLETHRRSAKLAEEDALATVREALGSEARTIFAASR